MSLKIYSRITLKTVAGDLNKQFSKTRDEIVFPTSNLNDLFTDRFLQLLNQPM